MEHRFISPSDGFIHCIAMCKQRVTSCSVDDVITTILNRNDSKTVASSPKCVENGQTVCDASKIKPELPIEVYKNKYHILKILITCFHFIKTRIQYIYYIEYIALK